jgi:hypothetical protein
MDFSSLNTAFNLDAPDFYEFEDEEKEKLEEEWKQICRQNLLARRQRYIHGKRKEYRDNPIVRERMRELDKKNYHKNREERNERRREIWKQKKDEVNRRNRERYAWKKMNMKKKTTT